MDLLDLGLVTMVVAWFVTCFAPGTAAVLWFASSGLLTAYLLPAIT